MHEGEELYLKFKEGEELYLQSNEEEELYMKAKSYIQNATHLSHQVDPSDAQGANHPQHHHQAAAHKSVPYKHGDHDG